MNFADHYLSKQNNIYTISQAPNNNLGLVVVIPCKDDPEVTSCALSSLKDCLLPPVSVEILVILNASVDDDKRIKASNLNIFEELKNLGKKWNNNLFRVYCILDNDLPKKHAGVGLARKIGMDTAVSRFNRVKNESGVIVSFDADCKCDNNYLIEIYTNFSTHHKTNAATIYFEHPAEGTNFSEKNYLAIILYELHIRYFVESLRYIGFPYPYFTVGSSFAVTANAYVKQGGMNKKQAGEDFYFLHKIFPLGGIIEIITTRVIPSPRSSSRVPFGTGPVIKKFLEEENPRINTYSLNAFIGLQKLFKIVPEFYKKNALTLNRLIKRLPDTIQEQLDLYNSIEKIIEINENCSSLKNFIKRFYDWFNAFMIVKYLNRVSEKHYLKNEITVESKRLLELIKQDPNPVNNPLEILNWYRRNQKSKTIEFS